MNSKRPIELTADGLDVGGERGEGAEGLAAAAELAVLERGGTGRDRAGRHHHVRHRRDQQAVVAARTHASHAVAEQSK